MTSKRGGARKGAGRKAGSGKGRTVISKTIAMTKNSWQALDTARGDTPRGKYIEGKLFPSTKGEAYEMVMCHEDQSIHLIPVV